MVLLHGMMSTAATWWRVGPALAERGWVVDALDLPGHGDWSRSARPLDLDTLVDGIASRLGGPVDLLVGHSLGGAVAAALASRRPQTARALVLEDPASGLGGAARAALADGVEADARLVRHDRARLVRREREANPTWADEDVEHSVDGIAAADWAAIAAGLRAEWVWDLPAMVAAVRAPLLVLAAAGDRRLDAGGSALQGPVREAVQAQLPPDRFVVLDGGHCLHRDLPGRWLTVVGGFADAVLGGDPAPPGRG
jgi:pimeloyl-ACP methyl ester carboxylesterase